MYWAKSVSGHFVILKVGDELVVPGIPQHKMRYVGPIGPSGEDVLDPPKGQVARLVHFASIPGREHLLVGERGSDDWREQGAIQARAIEVVSKGVVNRTLVSNCEHIGSYVRHGISESPQLKIGVGVGLALLLFWVLGS